MKWSSPSAGFSDKAKVLIEHYRSILAGNYQINGLEGVASTGYFRHDYRTSLDCILTSNTQGYILLAD